MHRYVFSKLMQVLIALALLIPAFLGFLGYEIYNEYSTQKTFQTQYGEHWQEQYAVRFGPDGLEQSKKKIIVAMVSIPVFTVMVGLFIKMLRGGNNQGSESRSGGRRRRKRRKNEW